MITFYRAMAIVERELVRGEHSSSDYEEVSVLLSSMGEHNLAKRVMAARNASLDAMGDKTLESL